MDEKEILDKVLNSEEMHAFRRANLERKLAAWAARQEAYRDYPSHIVGDYYHVTLKTTLENTIRREGIVPATAETKLSSGLNTEGKIYVCKELIGDKCSAVPMRRLLAERANRADDEFCTLKVRLDRMAYWDAYSSQEHESKEHAHSWITEEKIEPRDILGVMVLDRNRGWVTVDLDQWQGNG